MVKGKVLNIWAICFAAFIIRVVVLVFVTSFHQHMRVSDELLFERDDIRYIAGARLYSQFAESVVSPPALKKAFDIVEPWVDHSNGFEVWYWICGILMYVFNNEVILRLLNIVFAVLSVKCIFDICSHYYGNEAGRFAACLYAIMPYPVLFSCLLYKDQLFTLVLLLLLRKLINCSMKVKVLDFVCLGLGLLLLIWIRSGMGLAFLAVMPVIFYKERKSAMPLLFPVVFFAVGCILCLLFYDTFAHKFSEYMLKQKEHGTGFIRFFTIDHISQIWRYPFSYLLLQILPINCSFEWNKIWPWISVVGVLNIVSIPVALGNLLYLVDYKIKKNYFFWIVQFLCLGTIIASLGIVRHCYYLQVFFVIFFSAYIISKRAKWNRYLFFISSSVSISAVLIMDIVALIRWL